MQTAATGTTYGYPRWQRALEYVSIVAFAILSGWTIFRIEALGSADDVRTPLVIVGAGLFLALLFADFVSGLVHWAADNWGSAHWPIVGTAFIKPFREHHRDPQGICHHDFAELNGNNCLISLPTFGVAWLVSGDSETRLLWACFCSGLAWWVLGTNQFHAWAHSPKPPRFVHWLQRMRLILSPVHHAAHHRRPHDRNYCITVGWMNPILRYLRFFEILEWTVTRSTGVEPVHIQIRDSDLLAPLATSLPVADAGFPPAL